jgi:hypothetical protein
MPEILAELKEVEVLHFLVLALRYQFFLQKIVPILFKGKPPFQKFSALSSAFSFVKSLQFSPHCCTFFV